MAHPVKPSSYIEINNFYTPTVYEKGAEVVRMIYNILGPEKYRRVMDEYFDRFDGQAITTEDFLGVIKKAAPETNWEQFALWYTQAGTPVIEAQGSYDPKSQKYILSFKQNLENSSSNE